MTKHWPQGRGKGRERVSEAELPGIAQAPVPLARRTLAAAGAPFPARSQKFGSRPKRQHDSGHMLTRSGRIAVSTRFYTTSFAACAGSALLLAVDFGRTIRSARSGCTISSPAVLKAAT